MEKRGKKVLKLHAQLHRLCEGKVVGADEENQSYRHGYFLSFHLRRLDAIENGGNLHLSAQSQTKGEQSLLLFYLENRILGKSDDFSEVASRSVNDLTE